MQALALKVSSLSIICNTMFKADNHLNSHTKYSADVCYIHYYVISFRSDATIYSFARMTCLLVRVQYKNQSQLFYRDLSSHLVVHEIGTVGTK